MTPTATSTPDTGTELASRLRLAVMRLARRLRQLSQEPITQSQLSALAVIETHGPLTLGELAAHERVQPPTMTRIMAALEEESLVVRQVDPTDRRIARVTMTPTGRRLIERIRSRRTAYLVQRLRAFTAEEVAILERAAGLLERMAEDGR